MVRCSFSITCCTLAKKHLFRRFGSQLLPSSVNDKEISPYCLNNDNEMTWMTAGDDDKSNINIITKLDLTKMKAERGYACVNVHDNTGAGWDVCGGGEVNRIS